jgi:hypothetical protein
MGTRDGGKPIQHDVRNYSPPKGPTNINDPKGPGLHGHNCGNTNQPTTTSPGGSPGLHGTNKGNDGSQR